MRESDLEERVRGYVADLFCDGDTTRITLVRRLEGGNRHHVHRVTYRDHLGRGIDVVTRVSLSGSDEDRERASREALVLDALHGAVAPRLLDFDHAGPWFNAPAMCIEFIEGDERDLASATPADVERLGGTLAMVHDSERSDELSSTLGEARSISDYVDEWGELVASYGPRLRRSLPSPARELVSSTRPRVEWLLASALSADCFRQDEPLTLLHGDVGPGNIIWADRPVLVDWEYARLGDPADELAYIFSQHSLNGESRRAFWSGYAMARMSGSLNDLSERVRWWEPITLFASGLWWLERWSRRADADEAGVADPAAAKAQTYYLENAIARLERIPPTDPLPRASTP